jgi:predicted nicotinamide N-methyase
VLKAIIFPYIKIACQGAVMFSLQSFYNQYETEPTEITIAGRKFSILQPKYLYDFINPWDVFHEFPLWAKVWKASWILAGYLAEKPVETDKQFLEIGGGLGLVSIVACSFGHRISMTEYNPDALQFAQANAHLNHCAHLPILELDWSQPELKGKFDCIVASEVVYKKDDFPALLKLFQTYLKPDGKIILASEMRRTSGEFYKYLQPLFCIEILKKVLRSENEKTLVVLFKLNIKYKGRR